MLERAYHKYNLNPTNYPYNARRNGLPKNPRMCSVFYQPIRYKAAKAKQNSPVLTGGCIPANKLNSYDWKTENQIRFKVVDFSRKASEKDPFIVTPLDTRAHNPQSKQIFHLHRLNKKPVCVVQSWPEEPCEGPEEGKGSSVYMTSFKQRDSERRVFIDKSMKETVAEGIVPFNQPEGKCDVRSEMMLPVCETTHIPAAPNPHRYLLRKRKVPPVQTECGVFYPDGEDRSQSAPPDPSKISVTSLCGQEFTRRRYIRPPNGNIKVKEFDGGALGIETNRLDERYLPFLHVPPII